MSLLLFETFKHETILTIHLPHRCDYSNLIRSFKHNMILGILLLRQSYASSQIFRHVLTEFT